MKRKTLFERCLVLFSIGLLISLVGCMRPQSSYNSSTTVPGSGSYTTIPPTDSAETALASAEPAGDESEDADGEGDASSEEAVGDSDVPADAEDEDKAEPQADPLDWPYWRGPEYNGVSRETGLIDDWDPEGGEGGNVVWKRDDLGGRSTPVVLNGKLYTKVRDKPGTEIEGEKIVCVDLETGETIWENAFNVWLSDVPDTRVGWSSVVADPETGNVYALGVCGYFVCANGETGETIWAYPLHEKFGFLSTYGGRTNFPIICDDLVIISAVVIGWGDMAKPAHRFVAFDKQTGKVVWFKGTRLLPYDTTYSAPVLTVLDGQKAIVFGSGDGAVWALQPRTGQSIWKYRFSRRGLNVAPLVVDNVVYSGHSEENVTGTAMGAVVALDGKKSGDITESGAFWKIEEIMAGKTSPLLVDGRLFCFDDRAKLHVLDAETGEAVARRIALGTMMRASPLYADGKIYAFTANGRWYILKPDEKKGVETVSKGRLPSGEECHASPICSHGKIIMQSTGALYCLEDKSQEHGATERPPQPVETPVEDDPQPAHVQLVPAELLMYPGRITTFKVRLFNARGQLLEEVPEAEFELDGPGQVSSDGTFLAPSDAPHSATIVRATVGDLVGQARVRIVPRLPWEFDFEGLDDPPITWVGARYRHVIREMDGSNVMVKVTTIPKGTRSRCWFGHLDLHDYTIQADVRGAITNDKMPDIGLIAQGYAFDMQGANQNLQIRSWGPHEYRTQKTIEFPWKPDQWYTMKFQAGVEDDKAVLRGKVWPRGEDEPEAWTIEVVDERPNRTGSPGLFGNAKDAEIYLDNIKVFANEPT